MFSSLKLKLLSFFFIANLIILVVFSLFIYSTAQKGVMDNTDTMMKIISFDIRAEFKKQKKFDLQESVLDLVDEFKISPLEIKIIYYNKEKSKISFQSLSSLESKKLFNIPLNITNKLNNISYFNKEKYRVSSMQIFENQRIKVIFQLAIKKRIHSPYLNQLYLMLIIGVPIILIILLFIANCLIEKTLFSVKDVIASVKLIGVDNLSQRIDTEKVPSEIKELVETFNQLLNSLEDSFTRISSFSSDASHELKTPLTVIRGEIEVALRKQRDSHEYQTVLDKVLQEIIDIQKTIEQLLFITKKGSLEYLENYEALYLDELLFDIVEQNQEIAIKKNIIIKVEDIIPVTIKANEILLKIAFNNIIKNAILYSNISSEIIIYMQENNNSYFIYIQDFGYGIADKDIPNIFNRFYRVDEARSRQNSGTGLGLAIVKMILDIHNYNIYVESKLNKGTTMRIEILK